MESGMCNLDITLAYAGVVDHGLFLDMVDVVIIAAADGVQVKEK